MDFKNVIDRLNYLYHKSKDTYLTVEEKDEREKLKKIYVDTIKGNFKSQLKNYKKID